MYWTPAKMLLLADVGEYSSANAEFTNITTQKESNGIGFLLFQGSLQMKMKPGRSLCTLNPVRATNTCNLCGFKSSVDGIRKHMRRFHAKTTFMCPDCGKRFALPNDLKRHYKLHGKDTVLTNEGEDGIPWASLFSDHSVHTTSVQVGLVVSGNKPSLPEQCGPLVIKEQLRNTVISKHFALLNIVKTLV